MRKLIFLVCVSAGLCGWSQSETRDFLTIRLAVNDIYCMQTACSCVHYVAARTYPETLQRLKEEYGIELKFDYYEEPYHLTDAILSGKYDGAVCKPWQALVPGGKSGADLQRVVDILDPDNNRWLAGIVVVLAGSPFQTLDDLNGKRIVIGDSDAYEKHHAAKRLFQARGLKFGLTNETASCIENLGDLLDGEVDAAVVSDYALTADCAVDLVDPSEFRTLGRTENIPLTSVMLDANKISSADRKRVKAALLAVCAGGAPESLLSRGFVEPSAWTPVELEK